MGVYLHRQTQAGTAAVAFLLWTIVAEPGYFLLLLRCLPGKNLLISQAPTTQTSAIKIQWYQSISNSNMPMDTGFKFMC